jgi:serine/threonine-protein kinase
VWAPDGKHLVYWNNRKIWWNRADGGGQPQELLASGIPSSFSSDGRYLAYADGAMEGVAQAIRILPVDASDPEHPKPGKPEIFLATKVAYREPAFSPDGHWIAYASIDLKKGLDVFVRPFPKQDNADQVRVSVNGGRHPVWSPNGKELFYMSEEGRIMSVPYSIKGSEFVPGQPRQWSDIGLNLARIQRPMDLAPDGKSFAVMPGTAVDAGPAKGNVHVTFLLNFFDEVKRRMPAK